MNLSNENFLATKLAIKNGKIQVFPPCILGFFDFKSVLLSIKSQIILF